MTRRLVHLLPSTCALLAAIALPSGPAGAAIPQTVLDSLKCPDQNAVDCLRDNVFIIKGTAAMRPDGTVDDVADKAKHYCKDGTLLDTNVIRWNCPLDNDKVVMRFLEILQAKGWTIDRNQWDQIAVFQVDSKEASPLGGGEPMFFYRVPTTGTTLAGDASMNGAFNGVNEVDGIGIPKLDRNPNFPFVGYVTGGSTTDFGAVPTNQGSWFPIILPSGETYMPSTIKYWKDPDPAGVTAYGEVATFYRNCYGDNLCYGNFTPYQALAQVTSAMYGPYLRSEPEMVGDNWFAYPGELRSSCSPSDDETTYSVPLSVACGPCGAAPDAGPCANSTSDAAATVVQNGPCLAGQCPLAGLTNPQPALDASAPLLNLSLRTGLRTAEPKGFGEPILTVCSDNKKNLSFSLKPQAAKFNKVSRTWPGPTAQCDPSTNVTTLSWPTTTAGPRRYRMRPFMWNSFIDMNGSLMGAGNNWFENGNMSASNGGPQANHLASPPFRNARMFVFSPIELWLMGLLPVDAIPPIRLYDIDINLLIAPSGYDKFNSQAGPRSGIPAVNDWLHRDQSDPVTFASAGRADDVTFQELMQSKTPPARDPDFAAVAATHFLRQAWIVVTKPENRVPVKGSIECSEKLIACRDDEAQYPNDEDCDAVRRLTAKAKAAMGAAYDSTKVELPTGCKLDPTAYQARLDAINERHLSLMTRWRKNWQQYYYMLTGYRGRVVSNFPGTYDDQAYWEFVQKADDEKTFVAGGGLEREISGPHKDLNSLAVLSFANVSTPGEEGYLRFTEHLPTQLPLRIDGNNQVNGNTNAVLVRMRLPRKDRADGPWPKSWAEIRLNNNGPVIRLPGKAGTYLSFDGEYHTYTAQLWTSNTVDRQDRPVVTTDSAQQAIVDQFVQGVYSGFDFVPSTLPVTCNDVMNLDDPDCLKIEYIRFSSIGDKEDSDDLDFGCDNKPKADGWIGLEDNCPWLYNPDQADADGNGIGDACEDADLDSVPNGCDNCPTTVNSRQLDDNDNGIGDSCDKDFHGSSCLLQPDAVAGHVRHGGSKWPLVFAGVALGGVFALLRFRRRRK